MRIPEKVGRYRITSELGRGAMGAVYRGHDPQLDRQVAIKMISASVSGGSLPVDEAEARFLREARVAARLLHPNLVAVYDAGREGNELFLVMELIEGDSLAGRLLGGAYPTAAEALEIAAQTAEALAVAHAAGVVHRDVKPANILLTRDGQVKVSDFGVAKAVGEGTSLTRTGSLVGSPAYMAPEQIKGEELDGRADLFSLGVVLYEMLLRRKPFPADTVTTLVYQILHEDPLADPALATDLPSELAELLRFCLAKEVGARVPDGRTLAVRCRAIAAHLAAPVEESPTRVLAARPVAPAEESPTRILATRPVAPARESPTRILPVAPMPPPAPGLPPALPPPASAAPAPPRQPPARLSGEEAGASRAAPVRRGWIWVAGLGAIVVGVALASLLLRSPAAPPAGGAGGGLTPLATVPASGDEPPAPVGTPFGPGDLPATATPTPTPEPSRIPRRPTGVPAPAPTPTAPPVLETPPPETPAPTAPAAPPPRISATYNCNRVAEFHIDPEEARVAIDGVDIGTSDDWDDVGGGKQWRFAGPGRYVAKLSLKGFRTAWVELLVDPGAEEKVCDVGLDLKELD